MKLRLVGIILLVAACKKEEPPPLPSFDAASFVPPGPTPGAMEKGAREQFATKFGCPAERVSAKRADQEKDREVFELSGCEHTLVLACRPHHANGAVYPDWADCNEQKSKR